MEGGRLRAGAPVRFDAQRGQVGCGTWLGSVSTLESASGVLVWWADGKN